MTIVFNTLDIEGTEDTNVRYVIAKGDEAIIMMVRADVVMETDIMEAMAAVVDMDVVMIVGSF